MNAGLQTDSDSGVIYVVLLGLLLFVDYCEQQQQSDSMAVSIQHRLQLLQM